jgi:hypothetical protein
MKAHTHTQRWDRRINMYAEVGSKVTEGVV